MGQKRIELIYENVVRGSAELRQLVDAAKSLVDQTKAHTAAGKEAEESHKKQSSAVRDHAGELARLAAAAAAYGATVKALTIDTATYAARTQTLGVVTDQLARVNNLSVGSVRSQVQAVRSLGITTQESLSTANKMIFAQLDLAKATDLARLSQNAAVIAGINSSEALAGIIHGITTRQPEVLRTYGLLVTFEQDFAKAARALGRDLTDAEKTQVALNRVLAEGAKITGAYEVSMLTAGKQMTSLSRYVDEARNSIGEHLVPALGRAVGLMTDLAKYAENNGEAFTKMAVGVTALGAGLAAARFMPGPWQLKAAAGVAAAGATWFAGNVDPVDYYSDQGKAAIAAIRSQQANINKSLSEQGLDSVKAQGLRDRYAMLDEQVENLRAQIIENLAPIYRERLKESITPRFGWKGGWAEGSKPAIPDLDLGGGVRINTNEVLEGNRVSPGGALFNQAGFDAAQAATLAEQAKVKFKNRAESLERILDGLDKEGLDPLAKLLLEVHAKLRETVQKYGPMTAGQAAQIQQSWTGAFGREITKRKLTPQATDLQSTGFMYGWLPSVTKTVEVDPAATAGILDKYRERSLESMRRYAGFQERIVELTAGPGGELAAIRTVAQLREQTAYREFQITRDRYKLESDLADVRQQRMLSELEAQRRQINEFRDAAGRVFDSMESRGATGLRDFLTGFLKVQERTIFQNLAEMTFKYIAPTLGRGIPGQVDSKTGKLTGLGQVLQGTIFGHRDVIAMDTHTSAMMIHANALLGASAAGGVAAAAGSAANLGSYFGAFGLGGKTLSTQQAAIAQMIRPGFNAAGEAKYAPEYYESGVFIGPAMAQQENDSKYATLSKNIAKGAAIGVGAMGVYQGVKMGGARGALTAGSAALGTAAALDPEPVSRAVLMIASLAAGMATSLFGDPKKIRADAITEMLQKAEYTGADPVEMDIDRTGRRVDFDTSGRARQMPVVIVQIDALDSKSIEDRYESIGNAVYEAAQRGHAMVPAMREALFPA